MTKSITDIAREAGIDTSRNWERFESFARRHHAAILAELLAGVEMPEPVGAVYTINGLSHCTITKALDDTDLSPSTNAASTPQGRYCGSARHVLSCVRTKHGA